MSEFEEAVQLASKILERPYSDPDDDLAMLSRQFLRALECRPKSTSIEDRFMSHENGGWMNDDQRSAMKDKAESLLKKAEGLKGAVAFGLENGKRNLIVDLDVLSVILRGHVPVGNNELSPEELTERFYVVKGQRDKLMWRLAKIADMAADDLRCDRVISGSSIHQIEADAREVLDKIRGALAELPDAPSTSGLEIAARVWCDQEMCDCAMDVKAAEEIAVIIDRVRRGQIGRRLAEEER